MKKIIYLNLVMLSFLIPINSFAQERLEITNTDNATLDKICAGFKKDPAKNVWVSTKSLNLSKTEGDSRKGIKLPAGTTYDEKQWTWEPLLPWLNLNCTDARPKNRPAPVQSTTGTPENLKVPESEETKTLQRTHTEFFMNNYVLSCMTEKRQAIQKEKNFTPEQLTAYENKNQPEMAKLVDTCRCSIPEAKISYNTSRAILEKHPEWKGNWLNIISESPSAPINSAFLDDMQKKCGW